MSGNYLFHYLGDDESYFKALEEEFQKNTRFGISFKRVFESDESKIQSLFLDIYREQPAAVFIDFSKQTQDYLHLARLISRTPLEQKIVTVGLVDYLSPPEVLSESNATGVDFTHIKSTETYDVIFGVTKLIAPGELGSHGFATAKLKEEWSAGITGKVGFVHQSGIHVEANHQLNKGGRIKIKHYWQNNDIVPSANVFVRNVSRKNLFYHFDSSSDLDFLFVDEVVMAEGMDPDDLGAQKAEREEKISHHKQQLQKWLEDNASNSHEKKGKMLVIDRELRFYQDQPRSDKHSYVIRSIPYLEDISAEMDRTQPQVIAFVLDGPDTENPRNHHQRLVKLAEAIKVKYAELNPFFVVFNSPISSKEMQEVLGYTNVMATSNDLTVDLLVKMAELYEKKRLGASPGTTNFQNKVFLSKASHATIVEFIIEIKVLKLSETDMMFTCENELPIGTNLHIMGPYEMYVNVQPSKDQANPPVYHGLIHCLGEEEKKELRRFVNSVFFREHDAEVQNEADRFKKLNETKLKERVDQAAKKVQEEKEKKEKKAKEEKEEKEKKAKEEKEEKEKKAKEEAEKAGKMAQLQETKS